MTTLKRKRKKHVYPEIRLAPQRSFYSGLGHDLCDIIAQYVTDEVDWTISVTKKSTGFKRSYHITNMCPGYALTMTQPHGEDSVWIRVSTPTSLNKFSFQEMIFQTWGGDRSYCNYGSYTASFSCHRLKHEDSPVRLHFAPASLALNYKGTRPDLYVFLKEKNCDETSERWFDFAQFRYYCDLIKDLLICPPPSSHKTKGPKSIYSMSSSETASIGSSNLPSTLFTQNKETKAYLFNVVI